MQKLALFVFICLAISFACKNEKPEATNRAPYPGILAGRPDNSEDQYFIKRYLGSLGDDDSIPLDLLIVNWGTGKLTGQTYYPKHYGVLQFEGTLESDGSFELVEERFGERNASFVGKFYGTDSMSGTWWNIDSSKTMDFGYKEHVSPHDYDLWTGTWHLNDSWDTATLIIGGVTERKLQFAMNIYINDYREELYGTADIRGQRAVMDIELFRMYRQNCRLVFHRRDREIYLVQESFPFLCGLGSNCWITGTYTDLYQGKIPRLNYIGTDSLFVDNALYESFQNLVGEENVSKFAYNMERLEKHNEPNNNSNLTIWKGRVRGFQYEKEGIIMYDTLRNIWAATTSPGDANDALKVHYFTNVEKSKNEMPEAIKNWMLNFRNSTVVYESRLALDF